uniref:PDZ and LIM domain protein 7 (Trinotate prediction) n=1 Tax=Henneguya salminicola TaxID=69463 RepID=A0A6G3MGW5_HENSL
MSMNGEIKITLVGGAPYGIRIKGGAEFGVPISIENVTSNSKAANGGVKTGDVIIAINGVDVTRATHDKTKSLVSQAKDILQLTLKRGSPILSTEPAPTVNPSSAPTIMLIFIIILVRLNKHLRNILHLLPHRHQPRFRSSKNQPPYLNRKASRRLT